MSKVALITGASRGLGLALARALAERGWSLVIDARNAEALESARNELLEQHEERLHEALARALNGKETYAVGHPSPVPVAMMYAALRPLFPEQRP